LEITDAREFLTAKSVRHKKAGNTKDMNPQISQILADFRLRKSAQSADSPSPCSFVEKMF
jgi:hypothetical protein